MRFLGAPLYSCSCQITPLVSLFLDYIPCLILWKTALMSSAEYLRHWIWEFGGNRRSSGVFLSSWVLPILTSSNVSLLPHFMSHFPSQLPPLLTSDCNKKHWSPIAEGQFLIINHLLYKPWLIYLPTFLTYSNFSVLTPPCWPGPHFVHVF